jgi:hypothetical protein
VAVTITGGPYLQTAVFCDRVLRETDGVYSLIRIVDRWTVAGTTEQMTTTLIQTNLVIIMKSGICRGAAKIQVIPTSPSGQEMASVQLPVNFEGDDDRGIAIALPLGFPVQEPGLYWFDIQISGQSLTRVPLRVLYQQTAMQPLLPIQP